jgi:hypothetical protein
MKRKAAIILLTLPLLCGSARILTAKDDGKVLVYYFRNLTGNDAYDDLMYAIPLCLYERLQEGAERRKVVVVDQVGLEDYYEGRTEDLWNRDYILSVATKKRITSVLYGFFYIEGEKVILNSKIYYLDSGLILDVTEDKEPFYTVTGQLAGTPVSEVRSCAQTDMAVEAGEKGKKKEKKDELKIRKKAPDIVEQSRSMKAVTFAVGPIFPTGDFSDIYTAGVAGTLSYIVYPKVDISRFGIGFQTGAIRLNREKVDVFLPSETVILPIGASFQYALVGGGDHDLVMANLTLGLAFSSLSINNDRVSSIDLYSRGSIGVNVMFGKEANLALTVGLVSVSYKDSPLNMVSAELGLRLLEF